MLKQDQYYSMACEYMAKTELYDRELTNCRSSYDSSEAFIREPHLKKLSDMYALSLRKEFNNVCGSDWYLVQSEITKHKFYTAQMWIDEYYRIVGKGEQYDNTRI